MSSPKEETTPTDEMTTTEETTEVEETHVQLLFALETEEVLDT